MAGPVKKKGKTTKKAAPFQLGHGIAGAVGKLEASVTAVQNLDARAKQAVWGYARLDLLEHRDDLSFGKWNLRPVDRSEVAKLVQSFLMWGLDCFSLTRAIPIVVARDHVLHGSFAADPEPAVDLPVLALQQSALGKGLLVAAGGQHRLSALEQWLVMQVRQHDDLVREHNRVQARAAGDDPDPHEIEYHARVNEPKRERFNILFVIGLG